MTLPEFWETIAARQLAPPLLTRAVRARRGSSQAGPPVLTVLYKVCTLCKYCDR